MSDTGSRLRSVYEVYSYARGNIPLRRAWIPPLMANLPCVYSVGKFHLHVTDCEAFLAAGIPEAWSQEEARHAKELYEAQATLDLMEDGPTHPIGG